MAWPWDAHVGQKVTLVCAAPFEFYEVGSIDPPQDPEFGRVYEIASAFPYHGHIWLQLKEQPDCAYNAADFRPVDPPSVKAERGMDLLRPLQKVFGGRAPQPADASEANAELKGGGHDR